MTVREATNSEASSSDGISTENAHATVPSRAGFTDEVSAVRPSVARMVFVLATATILVIAVIAVVGDFRHRQQAMEQAAWHASILADRAGETGSLPLNLTPVDLPERKSSFFALESLPTQDAFTLRKHEGPVIVAQTVAQTMRLIPTGRAVVIFDDGHFDVEWMTPAKFERALAAQRENIRLLSGK